MSWVYGSTAKATSLRPATYTAMALLIIVLGPLAWAQEAADAVPTAEPVAAAAPESETNAASENASTRPACLTSLRPAA